MLTQLVIPMLKDMLTATLLLLILMLTPMPMMLFMPMVLRFWCSNLGHG